MTPQQLVEQALGLPQEERAALASRLIASLDADSTEEAAGVEAAWAAEIERRCDALDTGTTTTRSWDAVRHGIERDLLNR